MTVVMENTVEYSGCKGDVGKELVPLRAGFVGGKDVGSFFITSGNELKEEIGSSDIHEKVTDLVNDEHPVLGKDFQPVISDFHPFFSFHSDFLSAPLFWYGKKSIIYSSSLPESYIFCSAFFYILSLAMTHG